MEDYTQYELSELYDILSQVEQSIELKEEEEKQQAQANKQKGHKMKTYKLKDTSHEIITYQCVIKANSKKEALDKASDWVEMSRDLDYNDIEIKEQANKQKGHKMKRRKDNIKNSPNHYETHTRPYVEKLVEDFINKNQIMAYYGKDDTGIFEVRFSVKEQ